MSKKILLGLVGVSALFLAGCYHIPSSTSDVSVTTTPEPTVTTTPEAMMEEGAVIKMSASGFEPKSLTVKKDSTVTFKNEGDVDQWPASALHPTHQVLPGFDALKGVKPGESYTYTFEKVGTWKYHDHLNPTLFGSVTVTE